MNSTVRGIALTRSDDTGRRRVSLGISELGFEALVGEQRDRSASSRMESALRCYLGDRGTDRPAWPYPGFLRGSESQRDVRLELDVSDTLWDDFSEEASRQEVSIEQLAEHAAFYFAAELDAGRVTRRILDDLEGGENDASEKN
jgi:hypothetical protein